MALFGKKEEAAFDAGGLAAALRPFVTAPDRLPPGIADGAPRALPGLVMATAVWRGDRIDFLPMSSIRDIGGTQVVWDRALRNLESLDGLHIVREEFVAGRGDTAVVTISGGGDPFVASRAAVLQWLVEQVYGGPARHGVLVALPSWRMLILHLVTGAGVLKAAEGMALAATHWYETSGHEAVSPDVYLVSADRRAQRVAHTDAGGKIVINTTSASLLGEVLFTPPPDGLGLQADG